VPAGWLVVVVVVVVVTSLVIQTQQVDEQKTVK